jgi:hypothetical protein
MTRIIKIVLKSLAVLIVGLAVVLALWTVFDAFSFKRVKARASSVHPGDTMQSVISTLGEPRHTFPKGSGFFLKSEHKTLAYGSVFDWKNSLSK